MNEMIFNEWNISWMKWDFMNEMVFHEWNDTFMNEMMFNEWNWLCSCQSYSEVSSRVLIGDVDESKHWRLIDAINKLQHLNYNIIQALFILTPTSISSEYECCLRTIGTYLQNTFYYLVHIHYFVPLANGSCLGHRYVQFMASK
jgi:hypothetical protein